MDSKFLLSLWILQLIAGYYLIRPVRSSLYRTLLTIVPCSFLIYTTCHDLPAFHMSTIMTISLCWMIFIRFIHLTIFSPNETSSFRQYAWKFLWFCLPIIPANRKYSVTYYIVCGAIKLFVNIWFYDWMRRCEPNDSYAKVALFYIQICASTFLNDLQIVFVRLITFNKYELLAFNDYPILSRSIREFWGYRYNRLVGTLLKESIFNPIRSLTNSSATIAGLASFIVSGLLHVHVAVTGFNAPSPLPAFMFFLINALACFVAAKCPFTLPRPVGILLTNIFLILTAPLYIGLFTRAGSEYYEANKPPFFDADWLPKMPVPSYCPK